MGLFSYAFFVGKFTREEIFLHIKVHNPNGTFLAYVRLDHFENETCKVKLREVLTIKKRN